MKIQYEFKPMTTEEQLKINAMEIKILVPENRTEDLEKFIKICEDQGFKVMKQGGGKLPNWSGYYATLQGSTWECKHPYSWLSEDMEGLYCLRCKQRLQFI